MLAKIVDIGNSKGIRLPKKILEQCNIKQSVEISIKDNTIILKPNQHPRATWAEQFANQTSENALLLGDFDNEWDADEWKW